MKNFYLDSSLSMPNLINPENEVSFKYLSQFLNYNSISSIYSKEKIESLVQDENKYQQIIKNPSFYNINKLSAWDYYIKFIMNLIPIKYNEKLRIFLVLELFTKNMYQEKEFYLEHIYISYWIFYADLCKDDYEIFKGLLKKNICTNNPELYVGLSYFYEKYHAFSLANEYYLKGFENQIQSDNYYHKIIKEFEKRMENRINREINKTNIPCEEIDKFVHKKIFEYKNNENKGEREIKNIKMKFRIHKNKLKILEDNDVYENEIVQYDNFPIYIDENCRKKISKKSTELVELYKLIVNYLKENDLNYRNQTDNDKKEIIEKRNKKPYSWLNIKRPFGNQSIDVSNSNLSFFESFNDINNNSNINEININDCICNNVNDDVNNINNKCNPQKINQMVNNSSFSNIFNSKNLLCDLSDKELENLYNDENNELIQHKKKINKLMNLLKDELRYIKRNENNLTLFESENKNSNLFKNFNIELIQNNDNNNEIAKSKFINNIKNFLSNKNLTISDIKNKKNEIDDLFNLNKISLNEKNYFLNLLKKKFCQITQNGNKTENYIPPNFNEIQPIFPKENKTITKSDNHNNQDINKYSRYDINYLNERNTPTINKFFQSDNKNSENQIEKNDRFENLFLGKEDYDEEKEIKNEQIFNNLSKYQNDHYEYITDTNHISSITEKTLDSRKSSLELLFNS